MTHLEYYFKSKSAAEKRPIINSIIERCNVCRTTFYNWVTRKHAPHLEQAIIAEVTGIEQKQLYKTIHIQN